MTCKWCESNIITAEARSGPKNIFCSSRCNWMYRNNKSVNRQKICGICDEQFIDPSKSVNRKYCPACTPIRGFFLKYNIKSVQLKELLAIQKCQICDTHINDTKEKMLDIDHCHTTKLIRGRLCRPCNKGLGHFKDNIGIFKKVLKYLERKE